MEWLVSQKTENLKNFFFFLKKTKKEVERINEKSLFFRPLFLFSVRKAFGCKFKWPKARIRFIARMTNWPLIHSTFRIRSLGTRHHKLVLKKNYFRHLGNLAFLTLCYSSPIDRKRNWKLCFSIIFFSSIIPNFLSP